jgi:putative intracellular protease/amidase
VINVARFATHSLAAAFYDAKIPVASVCHGPGALINVKGKDGKHIFTGRRVTAFSNEEEEQVGLTDAVPFLVETKLKELGAEYHKNPTAWGPHVEVSDHVITGPSGQTLFPASLLFVCLWLRALRC